MEASPHEVSTMMMTPEEARKCTAKIREALASMPEWERDLLIEYALSLDKGEPPCLKH